MRVSIATKVFLGFAVVLVTSGLVSVYGILQMRRIGAGLELVSAGYFPLTRAAGSLEAFQKERERSTERLLDERDPAARRSLIQLDRTYFARALLERLQRAREQVQAARGATAGAPADAEALIRVEARLGALGERIAAEEKEAADLDALLERPEVAQAQAPREMPELLHSVERLLTAQRRVSYEIKALLDVIQLQMNRGVSEAEQQQRAARWVLVGLTLLALGVGLLITLLASRALAPISSLTRAAQALGRGSPESVGRIEERGADELAALAREFNAMAERLAARERQLQAQSEALVRSERLAAIGRIAAQITHEIRNPLSAIGLNAEELAERLQQGAEPQGAATRSQAGAEAPEATVGAETRRAAIALCAAIGREVDRLAAITEEYLRYARLPRPQPTRGDLAEVVRELLDFVRPELQAAGVKIEASLDAAVPPLSFDAAQVRQLLLNLLRNAREAMPSGGPLRLRLSRAGEFVEVAVEDGGPGIPPERLARIFDPFFTTKERGTGLGLALAQEIAQEHGGELTCQSAPGAGSTFRLRLPVQ